MKIKNLLGKEKNEYYQRVIIEMFYRKVYDTAYFIIKDQHLAQDIVQDTFIKAFNRIETLIELDKIESWLVTIASRTAIDYLRKRKKWSDRIIKEEYIDIKSFNSLLGSSVEKIIEDKYTMELLLHEISQLDPIDRHIIFLKYEYNLKYEEIASDLDMTIEAVKSKHYRAKLKLKNAIEKNLELEEGV